MNRFALLKNILQILKQDWANGTDKETAYLILDEVDKYVEENFNEKPA